MREKVIKLFEKASVDMFEKKASYALWGEKEIPKVILDEIKRKQK